MKLKTRLVLWYHNLKPEDFKELSDDKMIAWLDNDCDNWFITDKKDLL